MKPKNRLHKLPPSSLNRRFIPSRKFRQSDWKDKVANEITKEEWLQGSSKMKKDKGVEIDQAQLLYQGYWTTLSWLSEWTQ